MNDIQASLLYDPEELEAWLDSQPPLSDDDMKEMSAYYEQESMQFPENNLCDII